MSYWASLEIEMSLLGKRLSAGQFIKESVGAAKRKKREARGALRKSTTASWTALSRACEPAILVIKKIKYIKILGFVPCVMEEMCRRSDGRGGIKIIFAFRGRYGPVENIMMMAGLC